MKITAILFILCMCLISNPLSALESTRQKIIVIGNEPECITAAVTARKLGYDVTLVTESGCLGGLLTEGMLTILDINYGYNSEVLHGGFFKEFLSACSNGYNVDYHLTYTFFNTIIKKYGINVIYNAENIMPVVSNNKVIGIQYALGNQNKESDCSFIVDGSSEAEFTRKLGVPYKKGHTEFGQPHKAAAATLMFSVKDADWSAITSYLAHDGDPRTSYNRNAAWGFNTMYKCPITSEKMQMRGLNLSRQNDGSLVINALLIFDVDASQKKELEETFLLAKNELPHIVNYLANHCPGFEKATLYKIADRLYIREGVRIIGEDTLSGNDVFEHTDFPNTIAYGSYPMDLQATQKGEYGNALCGRSLYSIPLGTMIPKGFTNVLVIGKSASFDIMAHGSARTIPILMSMAENSMVAIDYSLKKGITLNKLNSSSNHLAYFSKQLYKFNNFKRLELPKNALNESWYYPYIHHLRSKGYFSLGYENYDLESTEHTKKAVNNTLTLFTAHSSYTLSKSCKAIIHTLNDTIKVSDLCRLISCMLNDNFNSLEDLLNKNIIDEITYSHIDTNGLLTSGEIYAILDGVLKKINPYTPLTIYRDSFISIVK